MWFPPTVGDNRLSTFLGQYEIELRNRLERDPLFSPFPGPTLEIHLEHIANQLRTGTYKISQPCFTATLMRLGISRDYSKINAWLRGSD